MSLTYVTCGEWKSCPTNGHQFVPDEEKGGKLLSLESATTHDELLSMTAEEYGIGRSSVLIKCSYLPSELIDDVHYPPVVISSDKQVKLFVGYIKKKPSMHLSVTLKPILASDRNHEGEKSDGDKSTVGDQTEEKNKEQQVPLKIKEDDFKDTKTGFGSNVGVMVKWEDKCHVENLVKKDEIFDNKQHLKARMEIAAMKYNFDYKVTKSNKWWSIWCTIRFCYWRLRAQRLGDSSVYIVTKYVGKHTCAPSSKRKCGRTASAKTIGSLIMRRYVADKGPTAKAVMKIMRDEQGVELKYSLAWAAREYAISLVRGIPEKSYGKIPKYLYMLKKANPGTHCHFETEINGRFKYLFLAFGQSIRGFHNTMRQVVVLDGTFLKNKYRGVLLVATAQDGNSNLYPIAFGVVDSENDLSWEWFLRQLNVVIPDHRGLAFVSDRAASISKGLEKVFPQANHGICIHHLLTNVVSSWRGRGLAKMVSKASKLYKVDDFKEKFLEICNVSRGIAKNLVEADIRKWARYLFPGYRYEVNTSNPAESINSALCAPREYPVNPLLDSIREMLTRWFYERRTKWGNHNHPLSEDVEIKVDRRMEKGKKFKVFPIDDVQFLVVGDVKDCLVNLEDRTCTCEKYTMVKIPCRHAIKAILFLGKETHTKTDYTYKTDALRVAYSKSINHVAGQEYSWRIPSTVEEAAVLPPHTRQQSGRQKKKRYESVEDLIRANKRPKTTKLNKCSRCLRPGHNKSTCKMPI